MNQALEFINRCEQGLKTLKCPHCKHGIQIEERNCLARYIQYKCIHCGYVEPHKDKLYRVILGIVSENKKVMLKAGFRKVSID